MTLQSLSNHDFAEQLETELIDNILPFWLAYTPDREQGGFYGAVTNDLKIRNDVPRTGILCGRILWTFSLAYRKYGTPAYRDMADWAYEYLMGPLWDDAYGGVYWSVDKDGVPVMDRKHHYVQAFAIYGLSEYHRATGKEMALQQAIVLFGLLEKYAFDPEHGGYIEGSSRNWGALDDMRLSDKEINCRKSMNTMLHILEAYTNLLRVWKNDKLRAQHKQLVQDFITHLIDANTGHQKLFFDDAWHSLKEADSYGHDIEASWLLWEAAEMHDDPALLAAAKTASLKLAEATLRDGRDTDGSVFYEGTPQGIDEPFKSWWVQAEATVGFYNAYQLSGEARYREAVDLCWQVIQQHFIDKTHGGWLKTLSQDYGTIIGPFKAGPWDCPYHHSRACIELITRLSDKTNGS